MNINHYDKDFAYYLSGKRLYNVSANCVLKVQ